MKPKAKIKESAMGALFFVCGAISVVCVLVITVYLIVAGLPAIQEIGIIPFLTGTEWSSTAA